MPQGRSVKFSSPQIMQNEPYGPSNRGIGPIAGRHEILAAVDSQLLGNRAIDHDQDSRSRRTCRDAVQSEFRPGDPSHRRDNDGKIFGKASGHNGIGGHFFRGKNPVSLGDSSQDFIRSQPCCPQEFQHLPFRGRDNGQPVGPALLEKGFYGIFKVFAFDFMRQETFAHGTIPPC